MSRIFRKSADTWLRVIMLFVALALVAGAGLLVAGAASNVTTRENIAPAQPVPFSHKHHVGGLGIDCRYCHTAVEVSASAGLPPTETCMTCHSQLWTDADLLAPVRQSWAKRTPIHWARVHNLPDFAYFDHSIHVSSGVGCVECHGAVDEMPLTRQAENLRMRFCVNCHDDPAPRLRPREAVFDMEWTPPADRRALGETLAQRYGIDTEDLTHCYICHR
ncbi:cytochrome c3 family protein [Caenispirillum salinarum]|uniref:cytochrome c3 family protein n=1 Tax=Caenispirillum salinarum TaxID=859058 RepID=UPI00384BD226